MGRGAKLLGGEKGGKQKKDRARGEMGGLSGERNIGNGTERGCIGRCLGPSKKEIKR